MSEQIEIDFAKPVVQQSKPDFRPLGDLGTKGLSDFVAFGGPQMYYDRLRVCADIIRQRHGQRGAALFYRLCERITPDETKDDLKRWSHEIALAGTLADNWKRTKEMAQRWAVEIRNAWADNLPCPIIPSPAHKHTLDMAIRYAGLPANVKFQPQESSE